MLGNSDCAGECQNKKEEHLGHARWGVKHGRPHWICSPRTRWCEPGQPAEPGHWHARRRTCSYKP